MSHVRTQIRDFVATALKGLATTGDQVLVGRTRPLPERHDPALLVYTTPAIAGGQETVVAATLNFPRRLERTMSLTIMGKVVTEGPCDDILDTIAAEVETRMAVDPTMNGLAKDSYLVATISQVDAEGSYHAGAIQFRYAVLYFTKEDAPETAV